MKALHIPIYLILISTFVLPGCQQQPLDIVTVTGRIPAAALGYTLPHEHVMVDFIGADSVSPSRYVCDSIVAKALPYLLALKETGTMTLIDCTPSYLGRDVEVLQQLSRESGINIVTNTGYYGAVNEKYLPRHAYTETAAQLAARWIDENQNGIDGTDIRPGFMKLSADKEPLTEVQKKIMQAGALAHLQTGLTIAVHTGDGHAAREELTIFMAEGVAPSAFIWIHAQNEENLAVHKELATKGVWVEFDGLDVGNIEQYVGYVDYMKRENLLHQTLLSHNAGWYTVGEPGGGNFRPYTTLHEKLLPRLREEGFSEAEIDQLVRINPAEAFAVRVRKMD